MRVFNHKQSPVLPYSLWGAVLVAMIRILYRLHSALWKSLYPRAEKDIEECPAHMTADQVLFLGYKYYAKAFWDADPERVKHFREQGEIIRDKYYFNTQISQAATISVGGDLLPYRRLRNISPELFWKDCGAWYFGSDLVFANLETPVQRSKRSSDVPEVMLSDMYFNADEAYMDLFEGGRHWGRGFDVLSVANNHALDQGPEGLEATLNYLNQRGIKAIGAGLDNAHKKWHMAELNGIKVSVHAFTYSLNKCALPENSSMVINHARLNFKDATVDLLEQEVKQARAEGSEFPLLYLHMGNAYTAYPMQHVRDNLRRIAEATQAPLILCGHGHNVQPAELMGNSLVFHSLGDFVGFDIYKGCRFPLALKFHLFRLKSGEVSFKYEAKLLCLDETDEGSIVLKETDRGLQNKDPDLRDWFQKLMNLQNFLPA